ncbi:unnamed protein product [Musa acuminata var. zebrina]
MRQQTIHFREHQKRKRKTRMRCRRVGAARRPSSSCCTSGRGFFRQLRRCLPLLLGDEGPIRREDRERRVHGGALAPDVPRLRLLGPRLHVVRRRLLLRPRRALHRHPARRRSLGSPTVVRHCNRICQHPGDRRHRLLTLGSLTLLCLRGSSGVIEITERRRRG